MNNKEFQETMKELIPSGILLTDGHNDYVMVTNFPGSDTQIMIILPDKYIQKYNVSSNYDKFTLTELKSILIDIFDNSHKEVEMYSVKPELQ